MWAIQASEAGPRPGRKSILWRLLTTLPVNDAAAALEKVQWYRQRWQIEVLHKVIKSGCKIEQRQLQTRARLQRVLTLDLIVAWRVMQLHKTARELPLYRRAEVMRQESDGRLYLLANMQPVYARGDFKVIRKLEKLLVQAKKDRVPKVMLRIQGLLLSLEGQTTSAIAQILRVHRSTVPLWIQNWNDHGVESLPEGHRCGRPAGLSRNQQASLADIINSGPVAAGFETGIWTSPLIAQVIAEEFSQTYHPGHVRKLLKQMGYSVQRPIASLVQADLAQHRKWVRYSYPNLKKTRNRRGR